MKIVSLAPHDIAVCAASGVVPAGGRDFVLACRSAEPVCRFPSRGWAKATASERPCRNVMGIPVLSTACRALRPSAAQGGRDAHRPILIAHA